jgi:hypothetical protein
MSASLGGPPIPPAGSVVFATSAAISVTTASSNAQIPAHANMQQFPFVNLFNDGTVTVFVALGTTSGATAATTNIPIAAGKCIALYAGQNTYVAAIAGSGTSTLRITSSNGPACPV